MFLNNYRYILLKLYLSITTSRSVAFSTCVLFISLIQSVNSAQFLNNTCLSFLSAYLAVVVALATTTIILLLTSIYASIQSLRLDISIEVLNLI